MFVCLSARIHKNLWFAQHLLEGWDIGQNKNPSNFGADMDKRDFVNISRYGVLTNSPGDDVWILMKKYKAHLGDWYISVCDMWCSLK